jgi:hypothetical protein
VGVIRTVPRSLELIRVTSVDGVAWARLRRLSLWPRLLRRIGRATTVGDCAAAEELQNGAKAKSRERAQECSNYERLPTRGFSARVDDPYSGDLSTDRRALQ